MHTFLRRLFVAGAICTLIAASRPLVAQDAGPVTKPLSDPNITDRLPAPKPSARQGPDGRIEVSWAPIAGAVSYRMWRSVPPTPSASVTLPNPQGSSYIDADVKVGSTYYYVVAAVNGAGIEGLKGGTTPVTATISLGPTTIAAPTVRASIAQQDPLLVLVNFSAAGADGYEIERTVYSSPSADLALIDYTRPATVRLWPTSSWSMSDPLPSAPYARSVSYAVRARLPNGFIGPPGKGDVMIPAAAPGPTTGGTTTGGTTTGGTTSGGATSGTTSLSGSSATGSTTLTVTALTTLATGATTSLASAAGSSPRWLSLNDAVATVDASGIVTARAGGTTQVIAVSSSSDGSVRVVAIPVAVKP